MMVSSNIDDVIKFLRKMKNEGYTSVELINDARVSGWIPINRGLNFVFCKNEPGVLGIDARNSK